MSTLESHELKNFCISSGNFRLDGGAMFGIIPKPLWNKVAPADELNRIDLELRLWLIQTKTRNIIIDTGIGDYHGDKFDKRFDVRQSTSPLEKALSQVGLTPLDITDLVLTHLHFDHVGGLAEMKDEKFISTLPNAQIHLHKKHFEYAKRPSKRDSGSFHGHVFLPLIEEAIKNKKITWLDDDAISIFNDKELNLKFVSSNGHTPHMIHPYTDKYIYLADIVPTSCHLPIAWVMGYDIGPAITTEDKERILKFVYDNKLTIIFEHDPKYWGTTLKLDERGNYVCKELFDKSSGQLERLN